MSLIRAVRSGVRAAMHAVREFLVKVEWTFVSADAGDYDPVADTFAQSENTVTVRVLAYEDKDDDTQMMFSSRGNFVETPTRHDTIRVLMSADDAAGNIPTVRDHFVWDQERFTIDNVERYPGDIVFVMRASRV